MRLRRIGSIVAVTVLFGTVLFAIGDTGAATVAPADGYGLALRDTGEATSAPVDSYGLVDPLTGIWHLYDGGRQATEFYFGNPGDYPFMGDWDCDDVDTPGLYRQSDGYVYLRNTNTQGIADISFYFGNPGDIPIAGDFNADGCDTVSIYRPSNQTFYIINELGTNDGGLGAADYSYVFGNPGDKPFIGDFNGNGQDTAGLHRESTGLVYYRNTNTQGNADNQFYFGDPGDRLVAGEWTGIGIDAPGLFRPSITTVYLRYENTQGNADEVWTIGSSHWLPVAGRFALAGPSPTEVGSIRGSVTEQGTGTPVAGVVVEVMGDTAGGFLVAAAATADDGSYEVGLLEPGRYDVYFQDHTNPAVYVDKGVLDVDVSPDSAATVDAQLVPWETANEGAIAGVVTEWGTAAPVAGITVEVKYPGTLYFVAGATTAGDGTYQVDGLDPGHYDVYFEHQAYPAVYVDKGFHDIEVRPGSTTDIDAEIVPWSIANKGRIGGVVTEWGTGTPVSGISVEVTEEGTGFFVSGATTTIDGSYVVDGLDAGRYDVHFEDDAGLHSDGWQTDVRVDPGSTSTVNVLLYPNGGPFDVEALVARYGPELRFHPGEQFYMDDPAVVFERSSVVDGHLVIPGDLKNGAQSRATVNVRVLPVDNYLDLQYWFFYPYNGHGWGKWRAGEVASGLVPSENSSVDTEIGRHWGDWEHVTVRLHADTLELHSVYLSRHSGGYWYTPDELTFVNGTHPVVYPGKFTHANYPSTGQQWYRRHIHFNFWFGHFDFDFVDYARDGGVVFQTWAPGATEIVSSALPGFHIAEPAWLEFEEGWGQFQKNRYSLVVRLRFGVWPFRYTKDIKVAWPFNMEEMWGPAGPSTKTVWSTGDIDKSP